MARLSKNKTKPFVLGTPPSKAERLQNRIKNEYPSPPASNNRKGGPGVKEIEFAKKMQGRPNEIKTQVIKTNLPEKSKWPVETEAMRLIAVEKRKARDAEIRADNKPANVDFMMDQIINAFPSDVDMVVAPNLFWDGGQDMTGYYNWLLEYYDGEMPEIVRRANAFRGFPQLDDVDSHRGVAAEVAAERAAERYAYYRSRKGRNELRPYLPAIQKYASKGEYELIKAQVNGQAASYAMAAAAEADETDEHEENPYSSDYGPSPAYTPRSSLISEAGPSSTYNKLKGEYVTPDLPAVTHAVDKLSSQLERSTTLGRTPPYSTDKESMFSDLLVTPNQDRPRSPDQGSTGMLELYRDELGSAYFRERAKDIPLWKVCKAQEALLDEEPKEEPVIDGRPVFGTHAGCGPGFNDTPPAYEYSSLSNAGHHKKEEVKDEGVSGTAAVAAPKANVSTRFDYSPTSDLGHKEEQDVKDEEMSAAAAAASVAALIADVSTFCDFSPISDLGYKEEGEEEVKDEETSAASAAAVSTIDLSVPAVPTPDPTPLKKNKAKASRKREDSFDEEWKPSPYDLMSDDDDKPLVKRVKKENPRAAANVPCWEA